MTCQALCPKDSKGLSLKALEKYGHLNYDTTQ